MDKSKPLVSDDAANISHGDLNPAPQVEKFDENAPTRGIPKEPEIKEVTPKEVESNVTVPENSVAPFAVKPVSEPGLEGRSMGVIGPK